jgi:hypothetical protein
MVLICNFGVIAYSVLVTGLSVGDHFIASGNAGILDPPMLGFFNNHEVGC